jgi:hypothetical protein
MTISELIDELGGASVVAAPLQLPPTTVASWKARESIPAKHWPGVLRVATERSVDGVTYERLVELHTADQRAAS